MIDFISNLVGNDYLATFFMSIIPLIELKGGIVFGYNSLGFFYSLLLAYLGSTVVFFIMFWLYRPIIALIKKIKLLKRFAEKIENYFETKAQNSLKTSDSIKSEKLLKQISVFIFVAIPLPMTGVWTGTAIAVFLNLKFKDAVLPIIVGNLIAGLLICLLSFLSNLIGINLDLILWILFALAVVCVVIFIVKIVNGKTKEK